MYLPWRDMVPLPEFPDLKVWTSLTEREAEALRELAAGRRVVEIGAAFGFSTLILASVAEHVWSIDPHTASIVPGNFNLYEPKDLERLSIGTLATLQANLDETELTDKVTICQDWSGHYLEGESPPADFAFIDGDHSFEACAIDLRNCKRIVGVQGVICVHDYACEDCPGVKDAVDLGGRPDEVIDSMAVLRP